jgi:hypothetical protein
MVGNSEIELPGPSQLTVCDSGTIEEVYGMEPFRLRLHIEVTLVIAEARCRRGLFPVCA